MSPRTATTGALRSRPGTRATTPVSPTRVMSVMPNRCERRDERAAVSRLVQRELGMLCRSRRSATRRRASSRGKWRSTTGGTTIVSERRPSRGAQNALVRTVRSSTRSSRPSRRSPACRAARAPCLGVHRPLRRDDVALPVARARAQIARKAEVRQRRERHVVRAADAALEHAAAPDGNSVRVADIVNRLRLRESADAPGLDVDDPPAPSAIMSSARSTLGDRLVEADRRLQHAAAAARDARGRRGRAAARA